MLGSKELGTNVLELQFVMLANHDQNNLRLVLDLLKVCAYYVKLESSYCRIHCANLSGSIDRELDLIDRKSCRSFFCRIFQLSPSPFDVLGFMFCPKYIRENPSHVFRVLNVVFVNLIVRSRGVYLHIHLGFPNSRLMSRGW